MPAADRPHSRNAARLMFHESDRQRQPPANGAAPDDKGMGRR
jgi:hypothetical protein